MPRVLVVEDDPDLLFLYQAALAQSGIETVLAPDANQGIIELNGGNHFDSILLDLNLPDAHGTVVLEHAVNECNFDVGRVIVVTANDHWIDSILNHGVEHILIKPVSMNQIAMLIQRIIS